MIHENVQGFDMEMARQAFQRDYAIYEIPVQTSDVGFAKLARRPRKYAIMYRLDAVRAPAANSVLFAAKRVARRPLSAIIAKWQVLRHPQDLFRQLCRGAFHIESDPGEFLVATPDEVAAELDTLVRSRGRRHVLSGKGCMRALTPREKESLKAYDAAFKERFGTSAKRCPGSGAYFARGLS